MSVVPPDMLISRRGRIIKMLLDFSRVVVFAWC